MRNFLISVEKQEMYLKALSDLIYLCDDALAALNKERAVRYEEVSRIANELNRELVVLLQAEGVKDGFTKSKLLEAFAKHYERHGAL